MNSTKNAFTLAEVLITLGIIGVVAAMTMPTIIANAHKKQVSSRLKKFYSTMSQAIQMSEVQNGECIYWDKEAAIRDDEGNLIGNPTGTNAFLQKYILPYVKYISIDENNTLVLADGSYAQFGSGNCIDVEYDTNGAKAPNEFGRDKFDFLICPDKNWRDSYISPSKDRCFGGYHEEACLSRGRDYVVNACKNNGVLCSNLMIMDNFEFKDDYPYIP